MPRHLFTTEQFLQLIANDDSSWSDSELIKGVIYDHHNESGLHDQTVRLVADALNTQRSDLMVCTRTRLQLSESSVIPDIIAFQTERTPTPIRLAGQTHGPLRLVVEVVGRTLEVDIGDKLRLYACAEVPEYWVLEPETRTLQKFTRPACNGREYYREMRRVDFAVDRDLISD